MQFFVLIFAFALPLAAHALKSGKPSRAADKGCTWKQINSETLGLALWAQDCDYLDRKIDHFVKGNALMQRFSDAGEPTALIETFELNKNESIEAGLKRIFDQHTADKTLVERCELKAYQRYLEAAPAGVKRYTFLPNAAYQKQLNKYNVANDEVPEPACGNWGDTPDGIQYFEAQPGNNPHRLMFVRVGQDSPLFDEKTLRMLPTKSTIQANSPIGCVVLHRAGGERFSYSRNHYFAHSRCRSWMGWGRAEKQERNR